MSSLATPALSIKPRPAVDVPPAPNVPTPGLVDNPPVPPVVVPRRSAGRNGDQLGLAWLNGSLQVGLFRRQKIQQDWAAPVPVTTFEEFAVALDTALGALDFGGTEVFLLLENDQFVHQTESAPAFSEAATRNYLKGRVARYEQERGPMLSVSQQTVSVKQDHAFILHLLPSAFYSELNRILIDRRLDLTRIVPMIAPIQRELDRFPIAKGRPVLVAVENGSATIVLVAAVGGQLAFARTILASWSADPVRIGLEINRSVLYAKQQFGLVVERIWLLGQDNQSTSAVSEKCGTGKQITMLPTKSLEWLQSVAKLSPKHPVNLLGGYLRHKRGQRFLRNVLLAGSWLCFSLLLVDNWSEAQAWAQEKFQLDHLQARAPAMAAERDHLAARNHEFDHDRAFIQQAEGDRLAPVPTKFLAYVGGILPDEIRLTDFSVKSDDTNGAWTFRLDGIISADEETARELLAALQRQMAKSSLRVRFNDAARAVIAVPTTPGATAAETQRFSVEGVMLEN